MSDRQYPDCETIIEMLAEQRALVAEMTSMQLESATRRQGDATYCEVTMSSPGDTSTNNRKNDSTLPDFSGDTSLQLSDASIGSCVPTDLDMSPEKSLNDDVVYEDTQVSYAENGFSAIHDIATSSGQFKTSYDEDESIPEEEEAQSSFLTPVKINSAMESEGSECSEQLEGYDVESFETLTENMSQIEIASEDLNSTGCLDIMRNDKVAKLLSYVTVALLIAALFFALYLLKETKKSAGGATVFNNTKSFE